MKKALLIALIPAAQVMAQQQPLSDATTKAQADNNAAAATAQQNINKMDEQTRDLNNQYANALQELDSLNKYNEQLQSQVTAQEKEKASIQTQLTEIQTTQREVLPLMDRMVQTLDQFVKADIPFYLDERTKRVENLKAMMGRADVAISEKYRRILEAYAIELDYGRTFEAYQGTIGEGANAMTVQFIMLGRVSLMYQTIDGSETGYWDASSKQWVKAPEYK
ncbi:MAG TPA: DUF3450 domain-containing protein, partial [Candidatus Acidoferrum sp.]|nr:DUF3450 domain-containing protein [Candidatus Acidoferrum sp.]